MGTIKTKPIAHARLESHTEEDVKAWFLKYCDTLAEYKITTGKNVINMDESGARIGCPSGVNVVVPVGVKELYTSSPENRRSVTIIETIIADGRAPPPPFIITPGHKIMENWLVDELIGDETIACSPTGYTNNSLALNYLDHLIKHTNAGPNKSWKLLLLDGHESHMTDAFQLKALESNIKPFYYPSHLTHALQPLDVGVFRPWKHYHNLAIQDATRHLGFQYTITSFFKDLTSIRRQALKPYTIVNAFRASGMWPPSTKAGLKKMRAYRAKQRARGGGVGSGVEGDNIDLPLLPLSRPDQLWDIGATVRALKDRDPTQFSDYSKQLYSRAMGQVDLELSKAHLTLMEHTALQEKLAEDQRRSITSRRSIHKGGASASIGDLRERIKIKADQSNTENLRKARKRLSQAINREKKKLNIKGIQAKKDNKARIQRLAEYQARNELPPPADLIPIRQPDKQPTELERIRCTNEYYEGLLQVVRELEAVEPQGTQEEEEEDNRVFFRLQQQAYRDEVGDYPPSSPPQRHLVDSSDIESDAGSLDSIQRNADFIAF